MSRQPEPILLRPALESDAEKIRWLEEMCMKDHATALWGQWQPSETLDLRSHEMIEHQGAGVGCMATMSDQNVLHLKRLYLAPTARNQGIGAACLAQVLARGRARHFPVHLRVLVNNPAIRFYARHGFIPQDRSPTHVHMIHTGAAHPKESLT